MPYFNITYQVKESIAYVTLNHPQDGNIISESLAQELRDVCQEINEDGDIRAAVFSGAGNKAFCLGNELERHLRDKNTGRNILVEIESVPSRYGVASAIARLTCPVIAAINGDALGQGLELILSCDIRITADVAHFGFPPIALGLMPIDGATQRLPRLIGKAKSLEMLLSGELISAQEAYQIGLVSKIVPQSRLASEVDQWAKKITTKAPIALRYAKEAINKGLDLTLEQGLRLEADLYFLIHTTEDRETGVRAFLEKKPPEFEGK